MQRSHIFVIHSGDRWTVKLAGCNVVQMFERKAHAVRAALQAANDIWSEEGVPTEVKVHVSPGRWEDAGTFGDGALPLAS